MMKIQYSEKISQTTLLGPNNRAVLWVHGCCFDCSGCIAQEFRFGAYQEEDTQTLADWFLQTNQNDLTISGGEPFLQAGALAEMLQKIRTVRDIGVILYTGFVYEALLSQQDDAVQALLRETDILIDGPYQQENDHNEPYRGSSNQRILYLTERYRNAETDAYYYRSTGRKIEIRTGTQKTMLIGVPSLEQKRLWEYLVCVGQPVSEKKDVTVVAKK